MKTLLLAQLATLAASLSNIGNAHAELSALVNAMPEDPAIEPPAKMEGFRFGQPYSMGSNTVLAIPLEWDHPESGCQAYVDYIGVDNPSGPQEWTYLDNYSSDQLTLVLQNPITPFVQKLQFRLRSRRMSDDMFSEPVLLDFTAQEYPGT